MQRLHWRSICLMLVLGAAACAPIEHQQTLVAGSTAQTTVGVGDVVARVDKTRDLKNAFGAADIYGRKTFEGYSELRFAGTDPDGTVVLFRQDLNVETDEDVFTRMGMGVATTNSSASASIVGNTVQGSGTSTTLYTQPRQATAFAIPIGAIPIRVPPGTSAIPFSGVQVEIVRADPVSLTYRLIQ